MSTSRNKNTRMYIDPEKQSLRSIKFVLYTKTKTRIVDFSKILKKLESFGLTISEKLTLAEESRRSVAVYLCQWQHRETSLENGSCRLINRIFHKYRSRATSVKAGHISYRISPLRFFRTSPIEFYVIGERLVFCCYFQQVLIEF